MVENCFYIELFDVTIHVCHTKDVIKYAKKYLKRDVDPAPGVALTYYFDSALDEPWDFLVALPQEPNVGTTMHEALHCAFDVLGYLEIKVSSDNHEVLAYLLEYVYKNLMMLYGEIEEPSEEE